MTRPGRSVNAQAMSRKAYFLRHFPNSESPKTNMQHMQTFLNSGMKASRLDPCDRSLLESGSRLTIDPCPHSAGRHPISPKNPTNIRQVYWEFAGLLGRFHRCTRPPGPEGVGTATVWPSPERSLNQVRALRSGSPGPMRARRSEAGEEPRFVGNLDLCGRHDVVIVGVDEVEELTEAHGSI